MPNSRRLFIYLSGFFFVVAVVVVLLATNQKEKDPLSKRERWKKIFLRDSKKITSQRR